MVMLFRFNVIYKHQISYRVVENGNKKKNQKSIDCLVCDCKNCLTENLMEFGCDGYRKGQ